MTKAQDQQKAAEAKAQQAAEAKAQQEAEAKAQQEAEAKARAEEEAKAKARQKKKQAPRTIKGEYSFQTKPECPFCHSLKTNATSTQGQWQYRKCGDCNRRFSVKGKKVG